MKARYLEYETAKFVSPLRTEPWMGILGPMIRAEVGDVVKVINKTGE